MVRTVLAGKRFHGVIDMDEILEASEFTFGAAILLNGPAFGCDSGCSYGPCHLVMVGDHNGLAGYPLEGRADRLIKGSASLETDIIADSAPANHAVKIIGNNRITQAGYEVFCFCALLLVTEQVRFHKDGTSLAELYRCLAPTSQFCKFLVNVNVEPLCLLFEK